MESHHNKYERDVLLQLRMHPFSLQKPENLPDIDVVKHKLHLYQMMQSNDHLFSNPSYNTAQNFQAITKNDAMAYDSSCHYSTPNKYWRHFSSNQNMMVDSRHFRTNYWEEDFFNEDVFKITPQPLEPWYDTDSYSEFNISHPKVYSAQSHNKREKSNISSKKKVLTIIDPVTGRNVLDSINDIKCTSDTVLEPKSDQQATQEQKLSDVNEEENKSDSNERDSFSTECGFDFRKKTPVALSENTKTKRLITKTLNFDSSFRQKESDDDKNENIPMENGDSRPFCPESVSPPRNQKLENGKNDLNKDYNELHHELRANEAYEGNANWCHRKATSADDDLKKTLLLLKDKVVAVIEERKKLESLLEIVLRLKSHVETNLKNLDNTKLYIFNVTCELVKNSKKIQMENWSFENDAEKHQRKNEMAQDNSRDERKDSTSCVCNGHSNATE